MTPDSDILLQFFGAYFHEDWDTDHPDWQSVVQSYREHATSEDVNRVIQAINALLETTPEDNKLGSRMFQEFGCYYDPRSGYGGLPYHEWLQDLVDYLISKPHTGVTGGSWSTPQSE